MKRPTIFLAAILAAATGTALAGDTTGPDPAGSNPAAVEKTQDSEYIAQTRSERLRDYLKGTFGPASLVRAAAHAGFDQWRDSPSKWPQGSEGYRDRFANAYARHFVRQTLQFGAANALHEDDRYFRSGEKGLWNRARYAMVSTVVARRENGERTFAAAKIGSAAGSAMISRAWMPSDLRDPGHAASSFGFTMAGDLAGNMIKEFWPDLKRCFRKGN